jgi:hypothetical protein
MQQSTLNLRMLSERILYEIGFLKYCSPYLLQMEISLFFPLRTDFYVANLKFER